MAIFHGQNATAEIARLALFVTIFNNYNQLTMAIIQEKYLFARLALPLLINLSTISSNTWIFCHFVKFSADAGVESF